MPEQRLSRWGVGPRIAAPSLAYTLAALWASYRWPEIFVLSFLPQAVQALGWALLVLGLGLWVAGAITVMYAYGRDRLVTSCVFRLVRHPVYSAWISLAFPGLALIMKSWPMLLTPFLAYAIFKRLIHTEDEYLEKRFGQAYLDYRKDVNEVLPIPRFRRKRAFRAQAG